MSSLPSRPCGSALAPLVLSCCLGSLHTLSAHAQVQPSTEAQTPAADSPLTLPPVVVTAPLMQTPLRTQIDPRAAQQPQPANDGASVLKALPGMNVTRKGGIDGDPVRTMPLLPGGLATITADASAARREAALVLDWVETNALDGMVLDAERTPESPRFQGLNMENL